VLQKGIATFYSAQFFCPELKLNHFVTDPQEVQKFFSCKTRSSIFIAQNAQFDVSVLRQVLDKNTYKIITRFIENRFIKASVIRAKHSWKIYDLKNIFVNWSLKKIGEFVKLKKLDPPQNLGYETPKTTEELAYFKKYALRDAQICYYAAKWVYKNLKALKVTTPSLSFHVFKRDFKPYGLFLQTDPTTELKLRQAYKGGRCECFIRGSPFQIVYVYDVVSLYPYIMQ
jgi:hypothetical protein